jgi:hypothetical protein
MFVYINTLFEVSLHEKTAFIYERVKFMVNFFQNKSYGESIKEIAMAVVVTTEDQLKYHGFGVSYSARSKSVGMLLNIDIALASRISSIELLSHIESIVCFEIEKLKEKKVKDFDFDGLLADMRDFFSIVKVDNSELLVAKFQDYSEEVKNWHAKKVKLFLKD